MNMRPVLALAAALALGLVGWLGLSLLAGEGDARGAEVASIAAPGSRTTAALPSAETLATAPSATTDSTAADALGVEAAEGGRSTTLTPYEQELAAGFWVEGRVVFPADTPIDSKPIVRAKGKDFVHGPLHEVEVGKDGRFRVAFASNTKRGRVQLDDRWLYIDESVKVKMAALPEEPLELEPKVGGVVVGRIVLPAGVEDRLDLLGNEPLVDLHGMRKMSRWSSRTVTNRKSPLDEGQRFEFEAIPSDLEINLRFDPARMVIAEENGFRVVAGEVRTVDLAPERGARITGVVLDDAGNPVEGATAFAEVERPMRWIQPRTDETDENGAFELEGVASGRVALGARKDGYLELRNEPEVIEDGGERLGVELHVSSGRFVAGTVVWPDGSPAVKVTVEIEPAPEPQTASNTPHAIGLGSNAETVKVRTDAAGAFRAEGLGRAPYTVRARKGRREVVESAAESSSRRLPKKRLVQYRTTIEGVEPGVTDLVVTLSSGHSLRGRVVDDLGAPIGRFRVRAMPRKDRNEYYFNDWERRLERGFRDEAGSFEMQGFEPGSWGVTVEAKGYADSAELRVEVPGEGELEFKLNRHATVAGTIRDTTGAPVEDATVVFEQLDGNGTTFYYGSGAPEKNRTDVEGRFELVDVAPGSLRLLVTAAGYADGHSDALRLEPAGRIDGVDVVITRGGGIVGRAFDAGGGPAARRSVSIQTGDGNWWGQETTDEAGGFELENVPPDRYMLTLQVTPEQQEELTDDDGQLDWDAYRKLQSVTYADVREGEIVRVTLGGDSATQIVVRGTVHVDGAAASEGSVSAWSSESRYFQGSQGGKIEPDSSYELTLDQPGEYTFRVRTGGATTVYHRTIPEGATYELDFVLETGGVGGQVTNADGEPLAGVRVRVEPDANDASSSGSDTTDDEGRFEVRGLPPGVYLARAGGASNPWRPESTGYGTAVAPGVEVVAGETTSGVELRLVAEATIRGVVHDSDGAPVARGRVHAFGPGGQPLSPNGGWRTDADGSFEVLGLPQGPVVIAAVAGIRASSFRDEFTVVAGGEVTAELVISDATQLELTALASDGEKTAAVFRVLSRDGLDVTGVGDGRGSSPTTTRAVGPLPAGRWTIEATFGDGSRTVERVTFGVDEPVYRVELRARRQ